MRVISRIIIHHSASSLTTTIEDINRWHRDKGWAGVGYHYVIHQDGTIYPGRDLDAHGAHCPQDRANIDSVGICVVGDNTQPSQSWTADQRRALHGLVVSLRQVFATHLPAVGHRDVPGTATLCPGLDVRGVLGS